MDKKHGGSGGSSVSDTPGSKTSADRGQAGKGSDIADIQGAWVRDDGAVCFGHECVVIRTEPDGALGLEIHPDECGESAGRILLEHLIKSAGKDVHISVPASQVKRSST